MMRPILLALALATAVSHAAGGAGNGTTGLPRRSPRLKRLPRGSKV